MEFRIDQSIFDEYGELDHECCAEYIEGLMEAFADSPEADPIIERYDHICWTAVMAEYGASYLGVTPADMSPRDLREILFGIFPRKVSCEPEQAEEVVAELRAFWNFAKREYSLSIAEGCLQVLGDDAVEELQCELSDSSNFGMAKSIVMMGKATGFDISTQEGMTDFLLTYNASLLAGKAAGSDMAGDEFAPASMPAPQRSVISAGRGPLRHRRKKLAQCKRAARKAKARQRNRKGKHH